MATPLNHRAAGPIVGALAPHRAGERLKLVLRDVFGLAEVRGGPVAPQEGRA